MTMCPTLMQKYGFYRWSYQVFSNFIFFLLSLLSLLQQSQKYSLINLVLTWSNFQKSRRVKTEPTVVVVVPVRSLLLSRVSCSSQLSATFTGAQENRSQEMALYYYYYYYYWTNIIKVSLSRKTSRTLYISQHYKKKLCSTGSVQVS